MSEITPASRPPRALAGGLRPISLRPSHRLAFAHGALLLALGTLAGVGLFYPVLNQPLWFLPLLLFWSLLWLSWRAQHRARRRHPDRLGFEAGQWWLKFPVRGQQGADPQAAEQRTAELIGDCVVWPGLLILPFRLHHSLRRYVLVCLNDTASAEDRRRLRVWLRTRQWLRERH